MTYKKLKLTIKITSVVKKIFCKFLQCAGKSVWFYDFMMMEVRHQSVARISGYVDNLQTNCLNICRFKSTVICWKWKMHQTWSENNLKWWATIAQKLFSVANLLICNCTILHDHWKYIGCIFLAFSKAEKYQIASIIPFSNQSYWYYLYLIYY